VGWRVGWSRDKYTGWKSHTVTASEASNGYVYIKDTFSRRPRLIKIKWMRVINTSVDGYKCRLAMGFLIGNETFSLLENIQKMGTRGTFRGEYPITCDGLYWYVKGVSQGDVIKYGAIYQEWER